MKKSLLRLLRKNPTYQKLIKDLNDNDWSHNMDHFLRVRNIALKIAKKEGGDKKIIEAACLLFDIARYLEQMGKVRDHAVTGAAIAKQVLKEVKFDEDKISSVCHAILVHRKSQLNKAETIEAKILKDADYLDALGAIDVARVFSSCLQSKIYKKTLYDGDDIKRVTRNNMNKSGIHYILYKISQENMQPENFYTKTGKLLAKHRWDFVNNYCIELIDEWRGII